MISLIPEWKRAWKFSSMRFLAFGGACQMTVMTTPDKIAQHIPDWIMQGLSIAGLACIFLAAGGRVTRLGGHHEPPVAP